MLYLEFAKNMNNILTIDQARTLSKQLKREGKKIILAGGCFDILHKGHVTYLTHAKKKGDVLFVMLESDETIKRLKGKDRPFHTQQDRAYVLSHLQDVDYVILLRPLSSNEEYDKLIFAIKPAIIATSEGDPGLVHKKRQAEAIGAKVLEVTTFIHGASTTNLVKKVNKEH